MYYERLGNKFVFEKNGAFLEALFTFIPHGLVKEYPHYYLLEQVPEVIHPKDFDHLKIDGKEVSWEELVFYTKDRLRNVMKQKEENYRYILVHFYSKKYDPNEVEDFFIEKGAQQEFSKIEFAKKFMKMDMINLRADLY